MYSGKGVNECDDEEKDRCWKITPARMATATDDSNLNDLRAYGKKRCEKNATKK